MFRNAYLIDPEKSQMETQNKQIDMARPFALKKAEQLFYFLNSFREIH